MDIKKQIYLILHCSMPLLKRMMKSTWHQWIWSETTLECRKLKSTMKQLWTFWQDVLTKLKMGMFSFCTVVVIQYTFICGSSCKLPFFLLQLNFMIFEGWHLEYELRPVNNWLSFMELYIEFSGFKLNYKNTKILLMT